MSETKQLSATPSIGINLGAGATAIGLDLIVARVPELPTGFERPVFAIAFAVVAIVPVAMIQRHTGDDWPIALAKALIAVSIVGLPGTTGSLILATWAILSAIDLASRRGGQ